MAILPLLDGVGRNAGTSKVLVSVFDFIAVLLGQPMGTDLVHVAIAELLETKDKEVVVHLGELATAIENLASRITQETAFDRG